MRTIVLHQVFVKTYGSQASPSDKKRLEQNMHETELNINDSSHASAVRSQDSPGSMLEAWIDSELR
jgi:hypothetical protein